MNVINRVTVTKEFSQKQNTIVIREGYITFNKGVEEMANLSTGKYIHFFNNGDEHWTFIVNQDKDGFAIGSANPRNGLRIISKNLIQMMKKSIPIVSFPVKFEVIKTRAQIKVFDVFEIRTHKSLIIHSPNNTHGKTEIYPIKNP